MPSAVVALTGASGAQYAVRLVEALSDASWDVDLIVIFLDVHVYFGFMGLSFIWISLIPNVSQFLSKVST